MRRFFDQRAVWTAVVGRTNAAVRRNIVADCADATLAQEWRTLILQVRGHSAAVEIVGTRRCVLKSHVVKAKDVH